MKSMKQSKVSLLRHSELEAIKASVNAVFGVAVNDIRKLTKGVSNNNYLITSDGQQFVIKCYSHDIPVAALAAQNKLACVGVTSTALQYDMDTRMAIFSYIPEGKYNRVLDDEALLKPLLQVHRLELAVYETLDLVGYMRAIELESSAIVNVQWLLSQLAGLPSDVAFCHNDLVTSNIICSPEGVRLIDFEYACHNDIFFDLAALVCSFQRDVASAYRLVDTYFLLNQKCTPSYADVKLKVYCQIYLLLSIHWYEQKGVVDEANKLREILTLWI